MDREYGFGGYLKVSYADTKRRYISPEARRQNDNDREHGFIRD